MDGWKIRRAVDLQEDSPPVERLRALATLSSRQAHDFVIVVLDGDKPADLTGMQPWLSMILPGRASLQKQVGKVQANVVSVTLPKIGYAERGDVSIILSLMDKDGQTQIPLYGCVMRVMEDSTDTIIDEGNVIPSLAELLAQFDACKAAAGAANTLPERPFPLRARRTWRPKQPIRRRVRHRMLRRWPEGQRQMRKMPLTESTV